MPVVLLTASCGLIPETYCGGSDEILGQGRLGLELAERSGLGLSDEELGETEEARGDFNDQVDGSGDWVLVHRSWGGVEVEEMRLAQEALLEVLEAEGGWFVEELAEIGQLGALPDETVWLVVAVKGAEPSQEFKLWVNDSFGIVSEHIVFCRV